MVTEDIKKIFVEKYNNFDFRILKDGTKTIEIQNANFEVNKPWIIREPNYEYAAKEIIWYNSESLNIYNMEKPIPKIWEQISDSDGFINSNYGWCIFSKDNYYQFENCLQRLISDKHTREACMIYNRPSMQYDYNKNGMHDFICTYSTQVFINERDGKDYLDYIVYMRSNDAVFGFNNDALWHLYVQELLVHHLKTVYNNINIGKLYWNAGSIHVYERHFKFLENK